MIAASTTRRWRGKVAARVGGARSPLDPNPWAIVHAGYDLRMAGTRRVQKLSRAREIDRSTRHIGSMIAPRFTIYERNWQRPPAAAWSRRLRPDAWIAGLPANNDLPGAKKVVADLDALFLHRADRYFAGYHEMAFVLSDEQRQLLFRMTPATFDDDRAWWGQALATAAWQQGDLGRARAYADSSLDVARRQIDAAPDDAQLRILNAASLAYAGRKAEAIREADTAMADTVGMTADDISYTLQQYVRTLIAADQPDRAMDALEKLASRKYYVTPGYLKTDPAYRSLDKNPRFQKLVTTGIRAPVD